MMNIKYLRNEYVTFGGDDYVQRKENGQKNNKNARNVEMHETVDEKPVKSGAYYCYKQNQNRDVYTVNPSKFKLGMAETRTEWKEYIYRGMANGNIKVNTREICQPVIQISLSSERTESVVYINNVERNITNFIATVWDFTGSAFKTKLSTRTDIGPYQTEFLQALVSPTGAQLRTDEGVLEIKYVEQPITGTPISIQGANDGQIECREEDGGNGGTATTKETKIMLDGKGTDARTIISESMDGYWKIIQETVWIKLKFGIKAWGTMGGSFRNWLVDSGFEKYEMNYSYNRDGQLVNATTVTYVTATGRGGVNQPSRSQTDYNGQFKVLQPGDLIEVWYTEDVWQIHNAIYAKNFQSDSKASGKIGPVNDRELIYRMNYIPAFSFITNKSGEVDYQYDSGGFAQLDASNYTGLAIILRFRCIGEKMYLTSNQQVPNIQHEKVAYIGENYRLSDGILYRTGTTYGFGAGYPLQEKEHDITVSYTVLKPSDPEFVTGGDNYQESITSELYDKVRDLQQQINDLRAEINISGVTSSVFEAITNIGNLPQMFSKMVDVFTFTKTAIFNLRKAKKPRVKPIEATKIVSKVNVETPVVQIINKMPEEIELGIIYNSIRDKRLRAKKIHEFDKFTIATEMELPMIAKTETLSAKFKKYLGDRGMLPTNAEVIEFDPMGNKLSMMLKEKAEILSYKIDPELAHEVLSEMSTSASRSLFSLNVRKQISLDNNFSSPSYADLVNKILDDGQLLDKLGKLNQTKLEEYLSEFVERIEDMLKKMA